MNRPSKGTTGPALDTEFLFELRIPQKMEDMVDMGQTPLSQLMYSVAEGGSFEGPTLKGEVIPQSGGDWSRIRSDRSIAIDVRICLKTHDGANILMTYQGLMFAKSEELFFKMINATKKDDPEGAKAYYYRIAAQFETGDPRYASLNHKIAIGSGRLGDNTAIYEVFAVN